MHTLCMLGEKYFKEGPNISETYGPGDQIPIVGSKYSVPGHAHAPTNDTDYSCHLKVVQLVNKAVGL